jgi:ketosteroid isomerase-like protein
MTDISSDAQTILAQERRALDRWAQGKPVQYFDRWAEDLTYFDDLGAHRRIDGIVAMRDYAASLEGKIPPHHFELVDPSVQLYGDIGIVTLRYEPFDANGAPLQRWKATLVYRRTGSEWRVVHAHWSMVKEP